MGHIAEVVSSMALSRPEVHFKLIHDNRTVKDWPATDRTDRVIDILGKEVGSHLVPVEKSIDGYTVTGWIGSPRVTRRTYRSVFVFVNGRYVRDRMIQHALFGGYSQRLVKGQYPLAVLIVTVPVEQVDVNVHPTKSEVRFSRHRLVHDLVQSAVDQALRSHDQKGWVATTPGVSEQQAAFQRSAARVEGRSANRQTGKPAVDFKGGQKPAAAIQDSIATVRRLSAGPRPQSDRAQETIWPKRTFSDLRVVGQVMNTYLVCESTDGLIIIDQHAAHERIVYEKLKTRSTGRKADVQQLLVPETVELGFREAGILEKLLPDLQTVGLAIEPFGGQTFVVKAVPTMLADREINPLITEITEKLAAGDLSSGLEQALDECLKIMACHSAIRARQDLKEKQFELLLKQLDACENPSHCPHGRPTWIYWNNRQLEKLFNRIV
jgi:DNA mismatch repair protein MutL